jgi:hypothetical protein
MEHKGQRNLDHEKIIEILRDHKDRLNSLGVKSLAIFGSMARGEADKDSDVDILVEFEGPASFDAYMETKFLLEELFDRQVDLVTRQAVKPRMQPIIEREAIYVA